MDFGERLRIIREMSDMSQTELAKKSGLAISTISNYERGICEPKAFALECLSCALEVTMDYLWNGAEWTGKKKQRRL